LISAWRDEALVKTAYTLYDKGKHKGDFAFFAVRIYVDSIIRKYWVEK
jgi:hypothetical protein